MPGIERKPLLTLKKLREEAKSFAIAESTHNEPALFGVTDGKAVGTYLEQKFQAYLRNNYSFPRGNSAKGIDFPELGVDIKVTSIKQPQSSCPFRSARQKIYGLGYLTISNALQWRLQYSRVIAEAGNVVGITRVR